MRQTRRFHAGGVEVVVSSAQRAIVDNLSPRYASCPPAGGRAQVELEFTYRRGFRGRSAAVPAPGFACASPAPAVIELWRGDGQGTICLPAAADAPLRGTFTVGSFWAVEAAIRVAVGLALPRVGGLLIHASAVAVGPDAILFAGPTGAGKSTVARRLAAIAGCVQLADDLVIARPTAAGRWRAHGPPFHGDGRVALGESRRIAAIHFLCQGPIDCSEPLTRPAAVALLLRHALAYVAEATTGAYVLDAASALVTQVPCLALQLADPSHAIAVLPGLQAAAGICQPVSEGSPP
jgi:hypothetical protein